MFPMKFGNKLCLQSCKTKSFAYPASTSSLANNMSIIQIRWRYCISREIKRLLNSRRYPLNPPSGSCFRALWLGIHYKSHRRSAEGSVAPHSRPSARQSSYCKDATFDSLFFCGKQMPCCLIAEPEKFGLVCSLQHVFNSL